MNDSRAPSIQILQMETKKFTFQQGLKTVDANQEQQLQYDRSVQILNELFTNAKNKDEFEYVCAMLRIRGMEDAGWDPLEETHQLFNDVMWLTNSPLNDVSRLRFALLIYCHLIEVEAIYSIIENMLRTIEGSRCSIHPFDHLYQSSKKKKSLLAKSIPPSARKVVNYLMEHAKNLKLEALAELIDSMFNDSVRNAFFHSDYTIFKDEFRTRNSSFISDNCVTHSIKIQKLTEIINKGLSFFQAFMSVYQTHRLSYKENKCIQGRFGHDGSLVPLTLLVHPQGGVYGFSSISTDREKNENF